MAVYRNYYRPGGTDVALADGGTGASLTDPNADRIMFWDDSAGAVTWLTAGTNLTITGTTIDAASGGSVTLIQELTAGVGGSASFDFTSISSSYRHLRLMFVGQTEDAAIQNLHIRFNNDSGNNYNWQYDSSSGASWGVLTNATSTAQGIIGNAPKTSDTWPGHSIVEIPYYANTTWRKTALASFGSFFESATRMGLASTAWNSTAAINQITVFSAASDLKQGSICSLYGIS